ncbi:MAG: FAD/NAD(P)-binding protein [Patescibacteria group bacterium]
MNNIYQAQPAKIISVVQESLDTRFFRLTFVNKKLQKELAFLPGQFVQIGLPGWGECPISICSSPSNANKFFELAIRNVGTLTNELSRLKAGEIVFIRGPYGNGFDIDFSKDKPLVIIGGGCGFVPLRPLIQDFLAGRLSSSSLQIFYGCLNEKTLLFRKEYHLWNRRAELNIILEKPSREWKGKKGLITDLLAQKKISASSVAVLVGPPVMYRFVIKELKKRNLKDENIYLSLERKMYCGTGVCQHCAIGPYYVCKDGPVFSWSQLKGLPQAI